MFRLDMRKNAAGRPVQPWNRLPGETVESSVFGGLEDSAPQSHA